MLATKYALRYEPLNRDKCNVCLTLGVLFIIIYSSVFVIIGDASVRDMYCFPFETTDTSWQTILSALYFLVLLVIILIIMNIHFHIIRHVRRSSRRVSSTLNVGGMLTKLKTNSCITVSIEFLTWVMFLVSAVCHNIASIDSQLRLAFILVALYTASSFHALKYLVQHIEKNKIC